MRKMILGTTGLIVSALCMGTVYLGSTVDEQESFRRMDAFADLGGNFLDTARVYADWLPRNEQQSSEKCIGRWLKSRGRKDILVATKGGHPPVLFPGRPTLSADELRRQAEDSCRHLGLDVLPLYYLHRDDPALPVEDIMDAVFALQDAGLVQHVGCSNWTAGRIRAAQAYAAAQHREGFCMVSNQWSLAQPVPGAGDPTLVHTDDDLLALLQESGLPLLPFTSIANGYLSKLAEGKPVSRELNGLWGLPENDGIARRAADLAKQRGMSVAQVSQCFFYAQKTPVIPVMSFSTEAQLQEAAAATELAITAEEAAWLLHG